MKIFITGAGGYIGKHITKHLLDLNETVIVSDYNLEGIDKRAIARNVDIFSDEDIFAKTGCPDVCLHMAWKDGFIHNSSKHFEYLSDHFKFIERMMKGGLKQIAVMGSMHEVGYHEGAIDEKTPCNPISFYGMAKDSLRRSSELLASNNQVIWQWIRAYYIYGDDKRNNSIFAKIIRAVDDGKKNFPFNSGKNKYDFIHVEKLAEMISYVIRQKDITGIINCCSGKPVALSEQVECFIKENNFDVKLDYGVFPDRPYDSSEIWGDNSKIKSIYNNYGVNFDR